MRNFLVLLVVLPLLLPQQVLAVENPIFPGVGLGPIRLGMSGARVQQAWGAPSRVRPLEGSVEAWQYDQHLSTVFLASGEVYLIQTNSPKFSTKEGIRVGARLREVLRAYGQPNCQNAVAGGVIYAYLKRGLLVRVVNDLVRGLSVLGAGGSC